jgi:hypothetical protein
LIWLKIPPIRGAFGALEVVFVGFAMTRWIARLKFGLVLID